MDIESLPIDDCLGDLVSALTASKPVILRAPPGAGKTTGVPPAILDSELGDLGQVLMLQPRRLAARAAAIRLSRLVGEKPGQTYGYHVRFDRKVSSSTKFVSMTSGILFRQLSSDPLLENVGCVIIDEFHERSIEVDLVLGMLQRIRSTLRPELRLVVMSATLDTEPIEKLIPDATIIQSDGRAFDVDIRYDKSLTPVRQTARDLADKVSQVLPTAVRESDGDILVFLPGIGEIVHTATQIESLAKKHSIDIFPLYGDLPAERQDDVLTPSERRKIVLATNVAETSITIPGVKCVIDTGLARQAEFDPSIGLSKLQMRPISKASADQRAGRAGRTAPGICFRLWPQASHRSRLDHTPPEVLRSDLSTAILHLTGWGERNPFDFPWVTMPTEDSVQLAHRQLHLLGAIDDDNRLTSLGQQLIALPVHPRLGRLILSAVEQDCVEHAAIAAALLSERDPFRRQTGRSSRESEIESDLIDRVLRLERFFKGVPDDQIKRVSAHHVENVARQLCKLVPEDLAIDPAASQRTFEERVSRTLLAAFPDRLARRRNPGSPKGVMVGSRGVQLDRDSAVRTSEFFLCLNVDGRGADANVRMASAIEQAWLPNEWVDERQEKFFHPSMKAVVARQRSYILDLMINENPATAIADEESAALLYQQAHVRLGDVLPDDQALAGYLARWRFLDQYRDETLGPDSLPITSEDALDQVLTQLCQSSLSFKDLQKAPWLDHLRGLLSYQQQQWLDAQAPEAIEVPSGNRIRLTYELGKRPILAVRIQEIFGWKTTPKLAGGSTTIQLHLLGPNYRPQQITDDLESFWKSTYHEVKKELKRRYPKHFWPDDPASASATRNGLKPR
ncbi:ATP-dependent helicase HrpB [Rhodopirellula sp. MGV]|uniref:ATP-dependent helicase HrpB n=1 Tax=Rhodopirellula sp. MGV TaxID=2023130 RepID=UPI000B95CD8B|nr:ATP-dependent helicase HrpB [Rhodopirellula sp. MGV]OYP32166.1 ATP-dependent helicase HrpB [Rhodopirellula sp. MGV]PNY35172.1 ATP-dependent helicase HrpB [Rhodopirellula baltica]